MKLDVIYLIAYGWCVRVVGTRQRVADHLPTQEDAIRRAREYANDLIDGGVRLVEVRIKTKWTKRVRDARTYPRSADPSGRG
jgi:hypothetical protein